MTVVHVVTQLEEMPAQETAEAVEDLTNAGLMVGGLILNMTSPSPLRPRDVAEIRGGDLYPSHIAAALSKAGVDDPDIADDLFDEALGYARRTALERSTRRALRELGRPMFELPRLPGGIDVGGAYELATVLRTLGAA